MQSATAAQTPMGTGSMPTVVWPWATVAWRFCSLATVAGEADWFAHPDPLEYLGFYRATG